MRGFLVATLLSAALPLAGCGLGALETIGCDFRAGSLNGPEDRCQERGGLQSTSFDSACTVSGGEVVEGGCDMEGVVAGCTLDSGSGDITDWYYAPTTLDEVTADCEGEGTVVEP